MTPLAIAALTAALMPAGHAAAGSDAGRMAAGSGSTGGRVATVAASSVRPSADVALVVAGVARFEGGWFAGGQATILTALPKPVPSESCSAMWR